MKKLLFILCLVFSSAVADENDFENPATFLLTLLKPFIETLPFKDLRVFAVVCSEYEKEIKNVDNSILSIYKEMEKDELTEYLIDCFDRNQDLALDDKLFEENKQKYQHLLENDE